MGPSIDSESTHELAEANAQLNRRVSELEAVGLEQRRKLAELSEAEERFRVFFDNAPIGKSMTAPDGKLLRVNPCFGAILGYSVEELQHVSFPAITHPDDLAESQECVRALLAGERDTWNMEKRYLAEDGHIVWTRVTTRLQRDAQNKALFMLTHVLDITAQKLAEQRLNEQTTLLRNLIESAGGPIFSVDTEYRYTSFNAPHASVMRTIYGVDIERGQNLLDYQRRSGDDLQTKRNLDRALGGETFADESYSGDEILVVRTLR